MTQRQMSIRELLENAHMDALGLLDEQDRAAFDAAFRAAPPALREQVRAEQARMARMESTLPRVTPDASLRDRVVQAVEHAITEQTLNGAMGGDAGVADFRSNRRLLAWRSGAIAMACAAVILGGAFVKVMVDNSEMSRVQGDNATLTALLVGFGNGPMRDALFNDSTRRAIFEPAVGDGVLQSRRQAVLFHNPDWSTMRLFTQLPAVEGNQTYRLVVLDDEGQIIEELTEFASTGQLASFEVKATLAPNTRVAIATAMPGARATVASILMTATV
jgi:hypothetical protein